MKSIKGKKLHEFSTVLKFLETKKFTKLLEIGGGKGNFSYLVCKQMDVSAVSVDMNSDFQNLGKERNLKELKDKAANI